MQLIRTAKMHLAAQYRLVSGAPQVVREGVHLCRKLRCIVIGTDGRYLAAGQERKSRWCTQGAIAIKRVEYHTRRGQRVYVRRLGDSIAVGRKCARGKLIRHQNQKVRTIRQDSLLNGCGEFNGCGAGPAREWR